VRRHAASSPPWATAKPPQQPPGPNPGRAAGGARCRHRLCLALPLLWLAALLGGCAALPDNQPRIESHYMADSAGPLARGVHERTAGQGGKSGFYLLYDGLDAFAARALLANWASGSIDAQYYLFHDDLTGNLLLERLLAAADRGVRVRLLIDDMATKGRDQDFAALDAHPHFELRLFNPWASRGARTLEMLTRFGTVTRRMHNKSFTVDGAVSVVGGRNIGDEYFSANPSVEFGDLDVLAVGPVTREVAAAFDAYWNHELAYPASRIVREVPAADHLEALRLRLQAEAAKAYTSGYAERVRTSRLVEQLAGQQLDLHWGKAAVFADQPDKLLTSPEQRATHMGPQLRAEVEDVARELLIFSPYFVPGSDGVDWLAGLAARGVRVRIVTNSLASNDVGVVHAGYAKYRKRLLRAGVELYETKATPAAQDARHDHLGSSSSASLHAKTFTFDRERLFVGSLNLDPRSAVLNTEMGIVFTSPELGAIVGDWFDNRLHETAFTLRLNQDGDIEWLDHQAGGEVIYTQEPNTGFWQRLGIWFARLLPIEGQL
jgi:putative cardiolipin synthase